MRPKRSVKARVPIFEIWSNEDADEYAAKTSGNSQFIMKTSFNAKYTRLVYAAPYAENDPDRLAAILDKIVTQMEK